MEEDGNAERSRHPLFDQTLKMYFPGPCGLPTT